MTMMLKIVYCLRKDRILRSFEHKAVLEQLLNVLIAHHQKYLTYYIKLNRS
jgi:hypothetical protein